ncbi:hypothetical protein [Methanobrevibacter curvatus]|uniref:Uncharacterized protein n=1 Tax=Methanobrevibacter curvatus TaxID=49547 RepID=A0A166C719_9EURY|nr:hypothetical protein [Methanobrevibacter curvatus]KZX11817.1 hypothetical protein MBCUR_12650 [Methanobrevibacter curvatus]
MEALWFLIAVVLAISDELHSFLMWNLLNGFYIVFAGIINSYVSTTLQGWLVHEGIEAVFHFFILTIVFLNPLIGVIGGLTHFIIDLAHSVYGENMSHIEHRALHFVIESLVFMAIFGL